MTSIVRRATGAMILALSLVLLPTGASWAEGQFDDGKLESFVTAALAVNQLVEEWRPRIQSAQNETEAAQLRDQANGELVAAIEHADGISIDEYRAISEAAQADPALMDRISQIFAQMQPQMAPAAPAEGQSQ